MNDEQMKALIAQTLEAQAEALALVVAAVSRQLDAGLLHAHLQQVLGAAKATGMVSAWGLKQTTHALAAVEAEIHLRKMDVDPTAH